MRPSARRSLSSPVLEKTRLAVSVSVPRDTAEVPLSSIRTVGGSDAVAGEAFQCSEDWGRNQKPFMAECRLYFIRRLQWFAAIEGGGGDLPNSQGNGWTADYLKITRDLGLDLRSNGGQSGSRKDMSE